MMPACPLSRKLDHALGLTDLAGSIPSVARRGRNIRRLVEPLFHKLMVGRQAGYEDVNDAERLSLDPVIRANVYAGGLDRATASTSETGRLETIWLARERTFAASVDLPGGWIARAHEHQPPNQIALDMDSSESTTYGNQEGSAYNGHFGYPSYHPFLVFNQFSDAERCKLRPRSGHGADGWKDVGGSVVARYRNRTVRRYFRANAAFASPEAYDFLKAEGYKCAIRLPANSVLQGRIGYLHKRTVGAPLVEFRRYQANFSNQPKLWGKMRRLVAKVEGRTGELCPSVGFIVTNLSRPAERVVGVYNQLGTANQCIKEVKNAIKWTRLSCCSFSTSAVRRQCFALAYNLATFMCSQALPEVVEHRSRTTLRERVVKIDAKLVRHEGYIVFQLAEVDVTRNLFEEILRLIVELRPRQIRTEPGGSQEYQRAEKSTFGVLAVNPGAHRPAPRSTLPKQPRKAAPYSYLHTRSRGSSGDVSDVRIPRTWSVFGISRSRPREGR